MRDIVSAVRSHILTRMVSAPEFTSFRPLRRTSMPPRRGAYRCFESYIPHPLHFSKTACIIVISLEFLNRILQDHPQEVRRAGSSKNHHVHRRRVRAESTLSA